VATGPDKSVVALGEIGGSSKVNVGMGLTNSTLYTQTFIAKLTP
jgi:hypothetical protein